MSLKPICVPCRRFFRQKKSGFNFIEGMPDFFTAEGEDGPRSAKPGLVEPERWRPYKIWQGDLLECPNCHAQIISGFGASPWSEHYRPDFKEMIERTGASQFQVNDC